MSKEEIEQFKKENCSKCTKNIDCKIVRRIDGKLTCTEEEQSMIQCLIDNKICPNGNKKCKVCKFDSCEEVLDMIDEEQKYKDNDKLKQIKNELPEHCKNCSFLEVIDLDNQVVRCPYLVKNKCLIK